GGGARSADYLDYLHPTEAVGGSSGFPLANGLQPVPAGRSATRYCAGYCPPVRAWLYVAPKKKAGSFRIRPSG
ncbi:hypothetical protein, partial [Bifidobacterium longum]|uniref:hypothetical protein n=1 Tax=Bifidobacterium longum TaxID=216816 RepID=UPI001A9553A0